MIVPPFPMLGRILCGQPDSTFSGKCSDAYGFVNPSKVRRTGVVPILSEPLATGAPMFMLRKKLDIPSPSEALPGRPTPIPTASHHFVNGRPLKGPYPQGLETAMFGMGCFWGAERKFWELGEGVFVTAVGYAAGPTPNPAVQGVRPGRTRPHEVVPVGLGPSKDSDGQPPKAFLGEPRPAPGNAQGNRRRTEYRSGIYVFSPQQRREAEESKEMYAKA